MADNVTLNAGSGGDTIAADEIGGIKHQKVKVEFGADGTATEVSTTSPLPITISSLANPLIDPFARLRVSNPATQFESQLQYTAHNSLVWDESITGGGASVTHLPNESSMRLQVSTVSGDVVIRQTKQYFRYQPGKGLLILMTGVMGAIKSNVTQRIGYFDSQNGIFFEQDGTNLRVVRRTFASGAAVDTAVNQSSWNLDTMNGSGSSGITINTAMANIFLIDIEWLGVGRVRTGFVIDGRIVYCHEFLNANVLTSVYMTTANLPCRYEIRNTNTTASSTDLKQICCTIINEGGYDPTRGVIRWASNGTTTKSVTTSLTPIVSIRLKSANIRGIIDPLAVSILSQTADDYEWQLVLNGSLTGASYSSLEATSIVEIDTSATAISGGAVLNGGYFNQTSSIDHNFKSDIKVVANIAGTSDVLTLACRTRTGSGNVLGGIKFRETI